MQFFIFIMRSNLNTWHFLCGGLTLSPKILEWPLVCHWKATNLSVTTSDVSPVILPLAFQKQLLHSHHLQQINLCSVRLTNCFNPSSTTPPMPPPLLPGDNIQGSLPVLLCRCALGWSLTKLSSCYNSLSCPLRSKWYKGTPELLQNPGEEWHFKVYWQVFAWQISHSHSEIFFITVQYNNSIFM